MDLFNSKEKQDEVTEAVEAAEAEAQAAVEADAEADKPVFAAEEAVEAPAEAEAEKAEEAVEEPAEAEAEKAEEAVEAPDEAEAEKAEEAVEAPAEAVAAAVTADGYATRSGGKKPVKIKKSRISYERKKSLYGYAFIGLWLIGTLYMFVIPLFQSMWYAMCDTQVANATNYQDYGMSGPGVYTEWNNFKHFYDEFQTDQNFPVKLAESLGSMLPDTFMILVFSLFIALLLNQKFRGRALARAVFFLPVLIATGPVLSVITGDMGSQGVGSSEQFSTLFEVDMVDDFMEFMGFSNISQELTDTISEVTSDLFNLIWRAGVQILIFLSALQQIPTSAKEAASMEGATGWEFFWKITFPTISPMILANLIYTVIDVFIDAANPVMEYVIIKSSNWEYGFMSAMAWTYFAIVGVALAIITAIMSKFVFYQVD